MKNQFLFSLSFHLASSRDSHNLHIQMLHTFLLKKRNNQNVKQQWNSVYSNNSNVKDSIFLYKMCYHELLISFS